MNRKVSLVLLCLFATVGCQSYRPLPLDEGEIHRELTPPSPAEIRVRAASLVHPLLPPIVLDERDGLSPDEAGVLAVLLNPALRAQRDRRALASAGVLGAGILPNPSLDTSLDLPSFGATESTTEGFGTGLSIDLKDLITRNARIQKACASERSVDLEIAWAEWQAAGAAKTAVYKVIGTEGRVALARDVEKTLEGNRKLVGKAVDAGQLTELDLAAARTALHEARATRLELERMARDERLSLNRALGLPPEANVKLGGIDTLPEHLALPAEDRLLAGLDRRRLDLVALRLGYESQEAAVREAILAQFPSIQFGVNLARDTGRVGTVGVGLTIELPLFDRNQAAIASQRATRKALHDEYVARVFETRSDVAQLRNAVDSLASQIEAAKAAEPGLEDLVRTYHVAVESAQADVLSYYTAVSDLARKRIDELALRQELGETEVALELATGLYRLSPPGPVPPAGEVKR
jgi:cobalt-zinc-cadmium efflux system outer membrane protein